MARRIISIFIVLALAFVLAACSASKEPETPDFEEQGIGWISVASAEKSGDTAQYMTICEKDASVLTQASVNVYSEPCEAPDGFNTPDGYSWHRLRMRMHYGDEAANEYGYRYCYFMTDYYDMVNLQNTISHDEDRQCDTFAVIYEGKRYKKCIAMISRSVEDWVMDEDSGLQHCSEILSWTLLLPTGYDGVCCGLYSASLEGKVETAAALAEQYDPSLFVIYRFDKSEQ